MLPNRRPSAAAWAFLLALLGYGAAAGGGAGLAWDGSWSLWRTLADGGRPFIAHGRWADGWPLWIVGKTAAVWPGVTPRALAVLYGGLLVAIPLGALGVCLGVLRGRWEGLRVWPVLGIVLAPLPGQWCVMSEATLVVQVGWALWALLATGVAGPAVNVGVALLAGEMFGLHPTAAVGFALAVALCWRTGRRRAAGGFAGLAVLRVAVSWVEATPYERAEVSAAKVFLQAQAALVGLPLALWAGMFALGAVVVARARGRLSDHLARAAVWTFGGATVLTGVAWAGEAWRWGGALDYRRFVWPAELPLLVMAGWHWRRLARGESTGSLTASRMVLPWAAGICAVTLVTQALVWRGLLGRFEAELTRAGNGRFVTRAELPFLHGTALDHWTACPLSLLLGNNLPGTAVFVRDRRDVLRDGAAVQVTPWDVLTLPPPRR